MRSFNTLKGVCLVVFSLFCVSLSFAQGPPANDDVCNALAIVVDDGIGGLVVAEGATAQAGEDALVPPISTSCDPHTWCENDGITASVWFTFVAPAGGIVDVDICGSSYDTQLAVYSATDCTDFSTFALLDANDDTPDSGTPGVTCGPPADPDDPMEVYGLSTNLILECLNPGETYYVVVDIWSADGGATVPGPNDLVAIIVNSAPSQGIAAAITATTSVASGCQGGDTGSASIEFDANYPIDIVWSNGANTAEAEGLTAGTYTVTLTDACGGSATASVDVADGPPPSTIILDQDATLAVGPSLCGDDLLAGTISLSIASGTFPFQFNWSDGFSGAQRDSLAAGSYTVTVSDNCGNPEAVQTFALGFTAGDSDDCLPDGGTAQLGSDPAFAGGASTRYSTLDAGSDNNLGIDGNVACTGGGRETDNGYLRVVDLATDFGLSGMVNIQYVEVIPFQADFGADWNGQFPGEMRLHVTDNADLTAANITTPVDIDFTVPEDVGPDGQEVNGAPRIKIPVNEMWDVDTNPLLVFEIFNPDPDILDPTLDPAIDLRWSGWDRTDGMDTGTYLYSDACGLGFPGALMGQIGFATQEVYFALYINDPSNGLSYVWDNTSGNLSADNIANPTTMTPGTYSVTVTDPDCGTTFTDDVTVAACTPVSIVDPSEASFMVTPNPSSGLFQLQNEGQNKEFNMEVYNLQGQLIFSDYVEMGTGSVRALSLENQAKGMYILQLTYGDNVEVHRLIVQ